MIVALSAPHQRFSLVELQRLDAAVPEMRERLQTEQNVSGFVMLATCHRVEVYIDTERDDSVGPLVRSMFIAAAGAQIEERLGWFTDEGAARHLCEVASGLASVVIGENEISGQVKASMGAAHDDGTMTPALHRLFRLATRTAKAVAQTDLGRQGRSLVSAAIGDDELNSVVIIGTGSFARVAVRQLQRIGCADISVFSPSGRGSEFAASHQVTAIGADQLAAALQHVDLVIGCSGQGEPTLTPEMVSDAIPARDTTLRIVDLALRPDVDPAVGVIPGVALTGLDGVKTEARVDDGSARLLVEEAVAEYLDGEKESQVLGGVLAMRSHVQAVAAAELSRAMRHSRLSQDQADQMRLLVHRITQGVLHHPTMRAKEYARQGRAAEYRAALDLLFGADPAGDEGMPTP